MTWREFQLRVYGYERAQKKELQKTRIIAYSSKFPALMAKSTPSIEKFMPIDGEHVKKGVTDAQREAYMKAFEKYKQQIKSRE